MPFIVEGLSLAEISNRIIVCRDSREHYRKRSLEATGDERGEYQFRKDVWQMFGDLFTLAYHEAVQRDAMKPVGTCESVNEDGTITIRGQIEDILRAAAECGQKSVKFGNAELSIEFLSKG